MKDGIIKPFLKTLVSIMSVLLWSIINSSGVYKFGDGLKISPTAHTVCLIIYPSKLMITAKSSDQNWNWFNEAMEITWNREN